MPTVVYTAIYGDRDDLKEPAIELKDCDLVCFTDRKDLESKAFEIRFQPAVHSDPRISAKIFKMLPHRFFPDYDYSVWVDASIVFKRGDIIELVNTYLDVHNMAVLAHSDTDCTYEAAELTSRWPEIDESGTQLIKKQIEEYKSLNFPRHSGFVSAGFILRRHLAPDVVRFDEDWWREIQRFPRDELSFNYLAWKNSCKYAVIPGKVWDNDYFAVMSHLSIRIASSTRVLERLRYRFVALLLDTYLSRTDLRAAFGGNGVPDAWPHRVRNRHRQLRQPLRLHGAAVPRHGIRRP